MKLAEKRARKMISCSGCGIAVPMARAYKKNDRYFCSMDCCRDEEFLEETSKTKGRR